jgi:RHS repeat-associated protein
MPVTNYFSLNGQIIGEQTTGGSRIDYAVDALGSVTGTLVNGAIQNTYSYKPHGALLAKSGAGADPAFGWVGSYGYKNTGRTSAESYVRARTYSQALLRWTTKDPSAGASAGPNLRRTQQPYQYGNQNPASGIDPSGLVVQNKVHPGDRTENNVDPARLLEFTEALSGCTGCDVTTGLVWRWAEYLGETDTDRAILDCTWQHEYTHKEQYTECCSAFGVAYRSLKTLDYGGYVQWLLRTMFYGWTDGSNAFYDEAAAYSVSAGCYDDYVSKCSSSSDPNFCSNMIANRDLHNGRAIYNAQQSHFYKYQGCPLPSDKKLPSGAVL